MPDRNAFASFEGDRARQGGAVWQIQSDQHDQSGNDRNDRNDRSDYRLCRNDVEHAVCNWAVPAQGGQEYCRSCALNQTIPNLTTPAARDGWHRLEIAKRRMLYTVIELHLPLQNKSENPNEGLAFSFLENSPDEQVMTGHDEGLITINVAEADDSYREKTRAQLGEAYRTILGHFRHEIGHYYWDRLIPTTNSRWQRFRALFGDEREDYALAQQRHYGRGPQFNWSNNFISAYASMHPWEDWAESWAHYLHMRDTLETAHVYGLALKPEVAATDDKSPGRRLTLRGLDWDSFDDIMQAWFDVTLALNSLNRSMGLPDSYPFVLSPPALEKLKFVHDVVGESGHS